MTGVMSQVVTITPRDVYRYGYRFWIARDSKLLLKSDLVGARGVPIEQVMFTQLGVGNEVSAAGMPAPPGEDAPAWRHQDIGGTATADPGEPIISASRCGPVTKEPSIWSTATDWRRSRSMWKWPRLTITL